MVEGQNAQNQACLPRLEIFYWRRTFGVTRIGARRADGIAQATSTMIKVSFAVTQRSGLHLATDMGPIERSRGG